MVDRFHGVGGAGILTAGLSAATLAGTGLASAHPQTQGLTEISTPNRRYLLTDGRKRVSLLGSMCAWVKDASQRPVISACGG
jgi:hypothetical protein